MTNKMKTFQEELDECYKIHGMQVERRLYDSAIQMLYFIKGMEYAKKLIKNDLIK